MKQYMLSLLMALLSVVFAIPASSTQTSDTSGKSLVIYYSLSGNTKAVAEQLRSMVGAHILEIQTVQPYPLDFHSVVEQAREERRTNFFPPIQQIGIDLGNYDTIYLGFPIWGNTIPQPMATFLLQNKLAGKTVIPFCTHDGYGTGRSVQVISEYCPDAKVLAGFDMLGSNVREAGKLLDAWLKRLGVSQVDIGKAAAQNVPITITMGETVLEGVLNNGLVAEEFKKRLPVTVDMGQFGNREFYGSISEHISTNQQGQLHFEDGDVTYCPQNNTVAIFYAQTDRPTLTMRVIPLGKVTSDLSVFHTIQRNVRTTFRLTK